MRGPRPFEFRDECGHMTSYAAIPKAEQEPPTDEMAVGYIAQDAGEYLAPHGGSS